MVAKTPVYIPLSNNDNSETIKHALNCSEPIFIFDIDETLYKIDESTKNLRRQKVYNYLFSLGFDAKTAKDKCDEWVKKYGVYLKGISHELKETGKMYEKLASVCMESVNLIKPINTVQKMVMALNGRKFCFTNASKEYCGAVLKALEMENCFEAVFHCDYEVVDFMCKPEVRAYEAVEKWIGNPERKNIHFFDDRKCNVLAATKVGWNGYWITENETLEHFLKRFFEK